MPPKEARCPDWWSINETNLALAVIQTAPHIHYQSRLAYETCCCFGMICKSGCICIVLGSGIVQYSSSSLLLILVLFCICFENHSRPGAGYTGAVSLKCSFCVQHWIDIFVRLDLRGSAPLATHYLFNHWSISTWIDGIWPSLKALSYREYFPSSVNSY